MNGLTVIENTAIVEQRTINADLFSRWTSYIDASPKTIETYSKAIRRLFVYLMENGITPAPAGRHCSISRLFEAGA